jgi:hypothetical protein
MASALGSGAASGRDARRSAGDDRHLFPRFPGIQRYIHETLSSVRDKGYSETLFGRKCWFPRIGSKNQAERQGSERAAINAPIQGTCADIIKRAMARMEPALAEAGLPMCGCCFRCTTNWSSNCPKAMWRPPDRDPPRDGRSRRALRHDLRAAGRGNRHGHSWGAAH